MKLFMQMICALVLLTGLVSASPYVQDSSIMSCAQLIAAGGTCAQLPNSSKVYDTTLGEQFSAAIINGDLANKSVPFLMTQQVTPANPAALSNKCYVKADNKFYCLSSLGVESLVGPGGGGGAGGVIEFKVWGALNSVVTDFGEPHFWAQAATLSSVYMSMFNCGSAGTTTVAVNQWRAGAIIDTATTSLASTGGQCGASLALSHAQNILTGDTTTVDLTVIPTGGIALTVAIDSASLAGPVGPAGPAGPATTPGGINAQIQYNNAGAFGGDTSTTDGAGNLSATSLKLTGTVKDGAAVASVDAKNRKLLETDGVTTAIDWSTPGKVTIPGVLDPLKLLLSGGSKVISATDAGPILIYPHTDQVAAVDIRKADGVTSLFSVDTTGSVVHAAALALPGGDIQTQINAKENSLGFTAEDVANKDTDSTMAANSDVKYPSQKAVKTALATKQATIATEAGAAHNFLTSYNAGSFGKAQPACSDLSNGAASCSTDTTNAANISSGLLALARGGAHADLSATGGAHQFLKQSGAGSDITVGQPAFSDISGQLGTAQLPTSFDEVFIDYVSGNDANNGSVMAPWKTFAHTCATITPTINVPVVIHVTGGNNDSDGAPISCPPNINVVSDYGIQISQPFTITGGFLNDTVSFTNIIHTSFTWIRNDATEISATFLNSSSNGLIDFEQQGAGVAASFLFMFQTGIGGGLTVQAGQTDIFSAGIVTGTINYKDSGNPSYLLVTGGDLFSAAFQLHGGISAYFSGAIADAGYSIVGTTTGSGTPSITSDSGSIPPPASITGAFTLSLTSLAPYVGYTPTTAGNWPVVPTTVLGGLDQLASTRALKTRAINTTAPITGGGDLSADRTIAMPAATNAVDGYLTAADHALITAAAGSWNVLNKTANYTAAKNDYVRCDSSGGVFAITLPAANSISAGSQIMTKKVDASANNCNIARTGADTIEFQTAQALTQQGQSVRWVTDGVSEWDAN